MFAQSLLLSIVLLLSLSWTIRAQNAGGDTVPSSRCTFSCPPTDMRERTLVKQPHAIGFDSFYSIFECIYMSPAQKPVQHTCSYLKTTGLQILGSINDNCHPTAIPCADPTSISTGTDSDVAASPNGKALFSNEDKEYLLPWVENGRYLLFLKEHHRG